MISSTQSFSAVPYNFPLDIEQWTKRKHGLIAENNTVNLALYIKNAQECLIVISKDEKAYEAQGRKPSNVLISWANTNASF